MTRLTRYRLAYLVAFGAVTALVLLVLNWTGFGPLQLVAAGLILLIPGRVQGVLWRDFFRGSQLLRAGRPEDAIAHLERFRTRVAAHPRLKRAIWLSWPGYSADVEVMALNNLGAARIELGRFDAGEADLRAALALDPQHALAWRNLALIYAAVGQAALAAEALAEAQRLGYTGGTLDQLQQAASGILARVEGRGSG